MLLDMFFSDFAGTYFINGSGENLLIVFLEYLSGFFEQVSYINFPYLFIALYISLFTFNKLFTDQQEGNYFSLGKKSPILISVFIYIWSTLLLTFAPLNVVNLKLTHPDTVEVVKTIENVPKIFVIPLTFASNYFYGVAHSMGARSIGDSYNRFEVNDTPVKSISEWHLGQLKTRNLENYKSQKVTIDGLVDVRKYLSNLKYKNPEDIINTSVIAKQIIMAATAESRYLKGISKQYGIDIDDEIKTYFCGHELYNEVLINGGTDGAMGLTYLSGKSCANGFWAKGEDWLDNKTNDVLNSDSLQDSDREAYGATKLVGKSTIFFEDMHRNPNGIFNANIKIPPLNKITDAKSKEDKITSCTISNWDSSKTKIAPMELNAIQQSYINACTGVEGIDIDAFKTAIEDKIEVSLKVVKSSLSDSIGLIKARTKTLYQAIQTKIQTKINDSSFFTGAGYRLIPPNTSTDQSILSGYINVNSMGENNVLSAGLQKLFLSQFSANSQQSNHTDEEKNKGNTEKLYKIDSFSGKYFNGPILEKVLNDLTYYNTIKVSSDKEMMKPSIVFENNFLKNESISDFYNSVKSDANAGSNDITRLISEINNFVKESLIGSSNTSLLTSFGYKKDTNTFKDILGSMLMYSIDSYAVKQYIENENEDCPSSNSCPKKYEKIAEFDKVHGYTLIEELFPAQEKKDTLVLKNISDTIYEKDSGKKLEAAIKYIEAKQDSDKVTQDQINENMLLVYFYKYKGLLGQDQSLSKQYYTENLRLTLRGGIGILKESAVGMDVFMNALVQQGAGQKISPINNFLEDMTPELVKIFAFELGRVNNKSSFIDLLKPRTENVESFLQFEGTEDRELFESNVRKRADKLLPFLQMLGTYVTSWGDLSDKDISSNLLPYFYTSTNSHGNDYKMAINNFLLSLVDFSTTGNIEFFDIEGIEPFVIEIDVTQEATADKYNLVSYLSTIQNPATAKNQAGDIGGITKDKLLKLLVAKKTNLTSPITPNFDYLDKVLSTETNSTYLRQLFIDIKSRPCWWYSKSGLCEYDKENPESLINLHTYSNESSEYYKNGIDIYHLQSYEMIKEMYSNPEIYKQSITGAYEVVTDAALDAAVAGVSVGVGVFTLGTGAVVVQGFYTAYKATRYGKYLIKALTASKTVLGKGGKVISGTIKAVSSGVRKGKGLIKTQWNNSARMRSFQNKLSKLGGTTGGKAIKGTAQILGKYSKSLGKYAVGLYLGDKILSLMDNLEGIAKVVAKIASAIVLLFVLFEYLFFIMLIIISLKFAFILLKEKLLPLSVYVFTAFLKAIKEFRNILKREELKVMEASDVSNMLLEISLFTIIKDIFVIIVQLSLVNLVFQGTLSYLFERHLVEATKSLYIAGYSGTFELLIGIGILVSIIVARYFYELLKTMSPKTKTMEELIEDSKKL